MNQFSKKNHKIVTEFASEYRLLHSLINQLSLIKNDLLDISNKISATRKLEQFDIDIIEDLECDYDYKHSTFEDLEERREEQYNQVKFLYPKAKRAINNVHSTIQEVCGHVSQNASKCADA